MLPSTLSELTTRSPAQHQRPPRPGFLLRQTLSRPVSSSSAVAAPQRPQTTTPDIAEPGQLFFGPRSSSTHDDDLQLASMLSDRSASRTQYQVSDTSSPPSTSGRQVTFSTSLPATATGSSSKRHRPDVKGSRRRLAAATSRRSLSYLSFYGEYCDLQATQRMVSRIWRRVASEPQSNGGSGGGGAAASDETATPIHLFGSNRAEQGGEAAAPTVHSPLLQPELLASDPWKAGAAFSDEAELERVRAAAVGSTAAALQVPHPGRSGDESGRHVASAGSLAADELLKPLGNADAGELHVGGGIFMTAPPLLPRAAAAAEPRRRVVLYLGPEFQLEVPPPLDGMSAPTAGGAEDWGTDSGGGSSGSGDWPPAPSAEGAGMSSWELSERELLESMRAPRPRPVRGSRLSYSTEKWRSLGVRGSGNGGGGAASSTPAGWRAAIADVVIARPRGDEYIWTEETAAGEAAGEERGRRAQVQGARRRWVLGSEQGPPQATRRSAARQQQQQAAAVALHSMRREQPLQLLQPRRAAQKPEQARRRSLQGQVRDPEGQPQVQQLRQRQQQQQQQQRPDAMQTQQQQQAAQQAVQQQRAALRRQSQREWLVGQQAPAAAEKLGGQLGQNLQGLLEQQQPKQRDLIKQERHLAHQRDLVRALVDREDDATVTELMQKLVALNRTGITALNHVLLHLGDLGHAHALSRMLTLQVALELYNEHTYATAFRALHKAGKLGLALAAFQEACRAGRDLGPVACSSLLHLVSQDSNVKLAWQLFDAMRQSRMTLNRYAYNCMAHVAAVSGALDDVTILYNMMKAEAQGMGEGSADGTPRPECRPDAYTFAALVRAAVSAGRGDLLPALFNEMAAQQRALQRAMGRRQVPGTAAAAAAAAAAATVVGARAAAAAGGSEDGADGANCLAARSGSGKWAVAAAGEEQIAEEGEKITSPEVWGQFLAAASRFGQHEMAVRFFDAGLMELGLTPNTYIYNSLLAAMAKARPLPELFQVYREMLQGCAIPLIPRIASGSVTNAGQDPCPPSPTTSTRKSSGTDPAPSRHQAPALAADIAQPVIPPDQYTFNALLTAAAHHMADLPTLARIRAEMDLRGVQINTHIGTSLINALRRTPEIVKAAATARKAAAAAAAGVNASGNRASTAASAAASSAAATDQVVAEAEAVMDKLVCDGAANVLSYVNMAAFYATAGRPAGLVHCVREILGRGLQADAYSWRFMIQAASEAEMWGLVPRLEAAMERQRAVAVAQRRSLPLRHQHQQQ